MWVYSEFIAAKHPDHTFETPSKRRFCISLLDNIEKSSLWSKNEMYHPLAKPFQFPSVIWFRGSEDINYNFDPNVFRRKESEDPIDETCVTHFFKLDNPTYKTDHQTTFEWLTLMQH